MPKALSGDLRERVIEAAEAGASRREAAERFEISASSAVPIDGPAFVAYVGQCLAPMLKQRHRGDG